MFVAYYDLWISPPTYDIVAFLCAVERERLRRGIDRVNIEILPGPRDGFRQDNLWPFSTDERRLMLRNVAIPMAEMLPCATVTIHKQRPSRRDDRSIGWMTHLYGLRLQVECMKAGIRPLRLTSVPLKNNRLITITLREADHWPQRNSNLPEWLNAAAQIRQLGYEVIIIRDANKAGVPIEGFGVPLRASIDLPSRASFYEKAACNLFVNNGPAWFCLALDAPTLVIKPVTEKLMNTCSSAYFAQCGLKPGAQINDDAKHQRIAWENDDCSAIMRAFEQFMAAQ